MPKKEYHIYLLTITLTLTLPSLAFAVGSTGFENATFSSYAISQSNAVTARPEEEPAAISYNPAGIADLKGVQVQTNGGFISVLTHLSHAGDGTKHSSTRSSGTVNLVPTGYFTFNPGEILDNRLTLGIGSDSPFGLSNKWDANHPAVRYSGWRNWLKMYTLKPTAAIKVTDWLSIGGGPMNYRIFDWGAIQAYPNVLRGGGADGQVRLNLSGADWGWHVGVLLKPHSKHQLGYYFRSPVKVHTRGRIKVERSAFSGGFETGGYADLDFPMNMTWAYAFLPTEKLSLEADLGYTRWSTYKRLDILFTDRLNVNDEAILTAIGTGNAKDYRDTLSIQLGGSYRLNPKVLLSAGSLFYTRAVPKHHYIPAVADGNRLAFSLGMGYQVSKALRVEAAYMNMLGLKTGVNNEIGEAIGGTGDGKYFSVYNVFVMTARLMWEDLFQPKQEVKKEPDISDMQRLNNLIEKRSR